MWVGEAAHFSTQLRYLLIRKTSVKALLGVATFPSHGCVGKNVTLEASNFNNTQQLSTNGWQQVQYQSVRNPRISIDFNRVWNLVRDQGVGGSNPLSPTIYFQQLTIGHHL